MCENKVITSILSKKDMEFYNVVPSDLDGIVAQLRQTQGVEVAIFLYELDSNEYKVSLRSNGIVDVSEIAQSFGGGGHVRAAGVTMKGTPDEIIHAIAEQISAQLRERG